MAQVRYFLSSEYYNKRRKEAYKYKIGDLREPNSEPSLDTVKVVPEILGILSYLA